MISRAMPYAVLDRMLFCRPGVSLKHLHLFPANLGDSACISETVQVISAVWQFGGRSGMIRQPQCRNWLHFYRITCRLSKNGRKKAHFLRKGTYIPYCQLGCCGCSSEPGPGAESRRGVAAPSPECPQSSWRTCRTEQRSSQTSVLLVKIMRSPGRER